MARIIDHDRALAWIIRSTSGDDAPGRIANEQMESAFMDLILRGGRVIDPAQGLDAIRDVGFANGRVAAVASRIAEPAKEERDVAGAIVTPAGTTNVARVLDTRGGAPWRATMRSLPPASVISPFGQSGAAADVDRTAPKTSRTASAFHVVGIGSRLIGPPAARRVRTVRLRCAYRRSGESVKEK